MVSLKRSVKVFCTVICSCFLFCVSLYAQTLDTPITECSGSGESRIMCTRDLPDGTTQEASGWCKCVRGMYQGGCSLPAYSYTERGRYSLKDGEQCRDCTVSGVTKGCSTLTSQVVDETPSCGEWYSCGNEEVYECELGNVQYKASGECGTSSRKCCSDGKWSGWDEECTATIEPVDPIIPIGPIGGGGTSCSCGSNEHQVTLPNGNCCCENNACGQTLANNTIGYCKCYTDYVGGANIQDNTIL